MNMNIDHMPFKKMHGLGNDFVIFDARTRAFNMTAERAEYVGNRKRGIGCDQLVVLRQSKRADVYMEIWNADGSRVGACGNVTRCVGDLICNEKGSHDCTIETDADILKAEKVNGLIKVDMGKAKITASEIPLSSDMDTLNVDLSKYGLPHGICTNMGNPHVTFFLNAVPSDKQVSDWGSAIETHSLFPERVNVSFAVVEAEDVIRLRVWERGAGITEACGTAACAAGVAAYRRGIAGRKSNVDLDGGRLTIEYRGDERVIMTGPVAYVFEGEVTFYD